ncbi:probable LRR receptor-like serine/threonine-protein kinase At4g36180 [Cryptomeria japonica]|uniref:probable LRR receptor-like serine/threonine-protein kinase At4g36180 n=1 Tax=Cryptomeria japonica TaxID=3369 RepID=UPI0025ACD601|nr:probable LRR receptor-like serine/threonine-protein kinase At4g36180 [Cryptomeria japonica]
MAVAPTHLAFISAFLIILFTSPCIGLFICPSQESQALLFFKEALKVSDGILSSWDNRSDCCSTWEGISCNYATGHVELVNLTAYTNHTEQGLQSGVISSSLCSLPFLKYLILKSIVGLTGNIPSCLGNLSYLQVLVLKNNSLTGIVPPAICLLTNLGHLDVSINQLVGILPPCLGNLTFPRILIVHYSKLTGQVPISLNKLSLLKFLSISGNKFNGSLQLTGLSSLNLLFARDFSLPENVTSSQLALPSSIKVLWLSHITITDSLFDNLAELKFLYVSYCVLNISASWLPSFQLAGLDLVSCSIGGRVPDWLFTQYSLQRLALADDNIVGEIPKWLMENNPQLFLFNISGNHFNGSLFVPSRSIRWMTVFDVSRNAFTGHVASTWPPDLQLLMVNDNSLIGNIPPVGNLSALKVLMMNDNSFRGSIPSEIVQLKQLQILDLSSNNISGVIPHSLGSLKAMTLPREDGHILSSQLNPFQVITKDNGVKSYSGIGPIESIIYQVPSHDELDMTVKGLNLKYAYIFSTLTGMDLSNNQLNGKIPWDFGKLKGLRYLNLSMNNLSGIIPPSLGDMSELESLDLSTNRLSGKIPEEIELATSLAVLNLSNNNLSGSIPQGQQMTTFPNTSCSGNPYLEGCPLPKKCSWPEFTHHPPPNDMENRNVDHRKHIVWYYIGVRLSHVAGYCCVMFLLALRKGWRQKYFKWGDKILKFLFPCIRNRGL